MVFCCVGVTEQILSSGFKFNKSLGQNFIADEGFLESIVAGLGIGSNDTVAEVGAGAGSLTRVLAKHAGRVISFEIDTRLRGILEERLKGYTNVELVFTDALKHDIDSVINRDKHGDKNSRPDSDRFVVVANIPYYITTPLLMKFINHPNCTRICVLIQDDVARRIVAKCGTKEYGALSAAMQIAAECRILKYVPRSLFVPKPNVDSAFVVIDKKSNVDYCLNKTLEKLLKGLFAARRKTVLNGLCIAFGFDREKAGTVLKQAGISETMRPEQLSPEKFVELAKLL